MKISSHRRRDVRLAKNARADAMNPRDFSCVRRDRSVPYDCLDDCHDDFQDDGLGECCNETAFGERIRIAAGVRTVQVEPTYPPSQLMKRYLDALWAFDDARHEAIAVVSSAKHALGRLLPRELACRIVELVAGTLDETLWPKVDLLTEALMCARFRTEVVFREMWYDPGAVGVTFIA